MLYFKYETHKKCRKDPPKRSIPYRSLEALGGRWKCGSGKCRSGKCRSDKVWKAIRKNTLKHQMKYGCRALSTPAIMPVPHFPLPHFQSPAEAAPFLAVPNVTAHLSTVSVPSTLLLYRVRQNKIFQRKNRDIYIMQEYFYTKFSTFIYHICLHKSV